MLKDIEESKKSLILGIKDFVSQAKADGVILGLSGGIDSTLSAYLAVEALSTSGVYGISLPADSADKSNMELIAQVAEWLKLEENYLILPVESGVTNLLNRFTPDFQEEETAYRKAVNQFKARIRMAMLYHFKALIKALTGQTFLIMGSVNKSESFTGYFTQYGDRGVDFEPLGNLYKTEIFQLLETIPEFPEAVLNRKPSSLGTDNREELDKIIDVLLAGGFEEWRTLNSEVKERVLNMNERARFKSTIPPMIEVTK